MLELRMFKNATLITTASVHFLTPKENGNGLDGGAWQEPALLQNDDTVFCFKMNVCSAKM